MARCSRALKIAAAHTPEVVVSIFDVCRICSAKGAVRPQCIRESHADGLLPEEPTIVTRSLASDAPYPYMCVHRSFPFRRLIGASGLGCDFGVNHWWFFSVVDWWSQSVTLKNESRAECF